MLPVQIWSYDRYEESFFTGAIGLHGHDDDLHLLDRVSHQPCGKYWDYRGQIRRSLVIGDELLTISDLGVLVSAADDLDEIDWLSF